VCVCVSMCLRTCALCACVWDILREACVRVLVGFHHCVFASLSVWQRGHMPCRCTACMLRSAFATVPHMHTHVPQCHTCTHMWHWLRGTLAQMRGCVQCIDHPSWLHDGRKCGASAPLQRLQTK